MKTNPKFYRLLSIFCWLGVALAAFLEGHLLHMRAKLPEVGGAFTRNALIVGVLLLIWLAAAVWFTAQARRDGRDKGE